MPEKIKENKGRIVFVIGALVLRLGRLMPKSEKDAQN